MLRSGFVDAGHGLGGSCVCCAGCCGSGSSGCDVKEAVQCSCGGATTRINIRVDEAALPARGSALAARLARGRE